VVNHLARQHSYAIPKGNIVNTDNTDDRCFCDGAGYADEPEWCEKCTPKVEKPTFVKTKEGKVLAFRRVYPEAPKFSNQDIEGIRYEFNRHYDICIHQSTSCWMCEIYIVHFENMPQIEWVEVHQTPPVVG
jgi:hypothetical protein